VTLCSASWSRTFSMPEPVDNGPLGALKAVQTGALGGGTWSWGSIPDGSYEGMAYSCDGGSSWTALTANGSCDGSALLTIPDLQVRITANGGQTYVRTYKASDYPG
jgi:hypothetical protein